MDYYISEEDLAALFSVDVNSFPNFNTSEQPPTQKKTAPVQLETLGIDALFETNAGLDTPDPLPSAAATYKRAPSKHQAEPAAKRTNIQPSLSLLLTTEFIQPTTTPAGDFALFNDTQVPSACFSNAPSHAISRENLLLTPIRNNEPADGRNTRQFGSSGNNPVRRYIPGPAGLLPDSPGALLRSSRDTTDNLARELQQHCGSETPTFTKRTKSIGPGHKVGLHLPHEFKADSSWAKVMRLIKRTIMATTASNENIKSLRLAFTVDQLLQCDAAMKAAYLIVYIKSVSSHEKRMTVKDISGEMQAFVHPSLFETSALKKASTLVLRDISLFRPTPETCFLSITANNIVYISPHEGDPQESPHLEKFVQDHFIDTNI